jgi:hypothetical protein
MKAGRRSTAPFQTRRASSYPGESGVSRVPVKCRGATLVMSVSSISVLTAPTVEAGREPHHPYR